MNLIRKKESTNYPGLFVKKYANSVFYDNRWHESDELLEARGHVETADGEIVIRPFTKIFNYNENGTTIDPDEIVTAVQKINGFMACATWVPEVNDVVVSTTGSLDSDYAIMARNSMPKVIELLKESKLPTSFMFEIVHPDDPHIIPENIGVYLIGMRDVKSDAPYFSTKEFEDELDLTAVQLSVLRPYHHNTQFKNILENSKSCKHEGYVVYAQNSKQVLKLKSPYYLASKALARRKDIEKLNKTYIDEEFYPLIEHLLEIKDEFNVLSEQARLNYIRNYFISGEYS